MKRRDFCIFTASAATAQTALRADHVLTGARFYAGPDLRPFEAMALAGAKLGVKTKFVAREEAHTDAQ